MAPDYALSYVLEGHSSDVRCIAVAPSGRIITASRDMTMRLWDPAPGANGGGAYICHNTVHHASWLTSLAVLPPLPHAANPLLRTTGGIVAGCKDGQIQVHDSEGSVLFVLPGHSGQVSSVSVTTMGLLISGSWDGSMRIWDLSTEKCIFQQDGFENSVTVLGLPNGNIATGSAGLQTGPSQVGEMKIRIYAPDKDDGTAWSCINTLADHKHRISELSVIEGVGFCSTSNDGTTRIRTLNGDVVNTLGQDGGEWSQSVCVVPETNEVAVAHDDGVLKLWRGSDIAQMLIHPREIWCVRSLPNGDLVTGCPQGRTTIWTRDQSRTAAPEVVNTYNRKTFETRSLIAAKTGRQLDVTTLPLFEQRKAHVGTEDGEIRQFNKGGKAFTFRWDAASRAWVELGEATGNTKQEVDGVYYDRVLPVEIDLPGQGLSNVKLGFNDGDNPYNVALKFCAKHKIDAQQVGQIVEFINQNRSAAAPTIGSTPINSDTTMAQFGEGHTFDMAQLMGINGGGGGSTPAMAEVGGQKSARGELSNSVHWPTPDFPQRLGLTFNSSAKGLSGMAKALAKTGAQVFSESQQAQLLKLLDTISETSRYHASFVTDSQVRLIVDVLASSPSSVEGATGSCPVADQFPFVDLLRGAVLHNDFANRLGGIHDLDQLLVLMMQNAFAGGTKVAHLYLFLQLVSNLLVSAATTEHALLFCDIARGELFSGDRFTRHEHKHVINGFATLLLNLSVHVFHGRQFGAKDAAASFRKDICACATGLMSTAIDRAEAVAAEQGKTAPMVTIAKRCFIAIGTARVQSSVEVDDPLIKSLCGRLIQLDPAYASFVQMVEDCVRMHHRARK